MEIINERSYNVMDGEPHLGKQIEMTVRIDREEYIEALVDAFINGACEVTDNFELNDGDLTQEYQLGCDLDEGDIASILGEMERELLDDDYGTQKAYNLLYELIDGCIPDDWSDEFEIINMKGY